VLDRQPSEEHDEDRHHYEGVWPAQSNEDKLVHVF
jgi:hypothetical protein